MRPRIYLVGHGVWKCVGQQTWGVGLSPVEAFRDWRHHLARLRGVTPA